MNEKDESFNDICSPKILCRVVINNTTIKGLINILNKVIDNYLIRPDYNYDTNDVGKKVRIEKNKFLIAINEQDYEKISDILYDYNGKIFSFTENEDFKLTENVSRNKIVIYAPKNDHKRKIGDKTVEIKGLPHSMLQQYIYDITERYLNSNKFKVDIPMGKNGKITDEHRGFGFVTINDGYSDNCLRGLKTIINNFIINENEEIYELKAAFFSLDKKKNEEIF